MIRLAFGAILTATHALGYHSHGCPPCVTVYCPPCPAPPPIYPASYVPQVAPVAPMAQPPPFCITSPDSPPCINWHSSQSIVKNYNINIHQRRSTRKSCSWHCRSRDCIPCAPAPPQYPVVNQPFPPTVHQQLAMLPHPGPIQHVANSRHLKCSTVCSTMDCVPCPLPQIAPSPICASCKKSGGILSSLFKKRSKCDNGVHCTINIY